MGNVLPDINLNVDASRMPNQLVERGMVLIFPLLALWLIFSGLDSGKGFFEKHKYKKILISIHIIKVMFIFLFLAYVIILFLNNKM